MSNKIDEIITRMATDVRDWSETAPETLCYGLIVGWDEDSHEELMEKHGFTKGDMGTMHILNLLLKSEIIGSKITERGEKK